uniref:Glycosyltransferase n=1 Tax=Oryza punctata TaxID=4537 RepID=A0A0E0JLA7_ORYPU
MAIESAPPRNERRDQHVVLLASPGAGHLLPVAELARLIVEHGGFTATIVTHTNFSSAEHSSTFSSLPPSISIAALPEVSLDDLPADARVETRILTVVRRALPHLRDLLRSLLKSPAGVAVFLSDLLSPRALAVAAELGIPRYVFFTSNLMCLTSFLHNPEIDRTTTCEFRDLPDPVLLPGCVPLHGSDLVDPVQDRANPVYPLVIEMGIDYLRADGFLVNTFDAMEHETLVAFKELSDKGVYPPAYAVGPFVRSPSGKAANDACIRWLDDQPDGSVLDKDKTASYFSVSGDGDDSPTNYLPEGFLERTKGTGLAVPMWVPQVEILNHRAVGGFVSHCGWNSTLEAVAAGVPMVAWPLYAEQRMNAVMLSSRAGLALRPSNAREDGVVTRDEVAAVAREIITGEKGAAARRKARELREAAAKATQSPGGPSREAFEAVVGGAWKKAAAAAARGSRAGEPDDNGTAVTAQ